MTGSEKYTWGMVLSIGGSCAFFGGILLSATLIGACLGVPMALIGLPLMVWGIVWAYQGHFQRQQEVISAGIREGIASVQAANINPFPQVAVAASGVPSEMVPAASVASDSLPMGPSFVEQVEVQDSEGSTVLAPSPPDATEEDQSSRSDFENYDTEGSAPANGSTLPS
jgi:hypothetical protein